MRARAAPYHASRRSPRYNPALTSSVRHASGIVLLASLACSSSGGAPETIDAEPRPAPALSPALTPEPAPSPRTPEPPRRSCRASEPPRPVPLTSPGTPVRVGDRSFVRAWRRKGADVESVLVSLDLRGALDITPIPVPAPDPQVLGADPRGLTLVSVPRHGTGTLLRVALTPTGTLKPGTPAPLPEVAWGWPLQFWSDGTRALLHHALATPQQSIGEHMLHTLDLSAGKVVATASLAPDTTLACDSDACVAIDITRPPTGPARVRLVRRPWTGGERSHSFDLTSTCPAVHPLDAAVFVAPGAPWRAVWHADAAPFFRDAATEPALAPALACAALEPFPSARRPGLLAARTLLRWDPDRHVFGASEPLPALTSRDSARFPHPDGVVELAWTGGRGMTHTPTDPNGVRRYYEHWTFEGGEVHLLRFESGRWQATDPAPLALAGAEGRFHGGYTPLVLQNGLHAAVLLAPAGGDDQAWLQPYLAPC